MSVETHLQNINKRELYILKPDWSVVPGYTNCQKHLFCLSIQQMTIYMKDINKQRQIYYFVLNKVLNSAQNNNKMHVDWQQLMVLAPEFF